MRLSKQLSWSLAALFASLALASSGGVAQAAAETYEVDAVHSAILFRTKHLNVSHVWGRFDDFSGKITLDEANPAASSVQVTVKAQSLSTGNAKRDDHLRSPDFFGVAQFPTITFQSTSVTKAGDAYEVTGNLSLHGVTKPVTVKMQQIGKGPGMQGKSLVGFEGTLDLKRSDFGMKFMVGPVSDDVHLVLAFEANR